MNLKSNLGILRVLALLEGISAILLTLVTVSKYAFDYYVHSVNYGIGLAHGVLFVAYCIWALVVANQKKWKVMPILLSLAASIFPTGTFFADHYIFAKEK